MEMKKYYELSRSSYKDSVKMLETDIQHANALFTAIPKLKGGAYFQMKLVHSQLTPLFFLLFQWLDGPCTSFLPHYMINMFHILIYKVGGDGRPNMSTQGNKATIREFYGIILPSLRRLQNDLVEQKSCLLTETCNGDKVLATQGQGIDRNADKDEDMIEEECGICLELCTKMVLPGCYHAMCINCYRDCCVNRRNNRSESCPFCRGGLKRIKSEDLWVLTSESEVIDAEAASREELSRFYLFIQSLPKDTPESLFWVYYDYLI